MNLKKGTIAALLLISHISYSQERNSLSIIPEPKIVTVLNENFKLSKKTQLVYQGEEARIAAELLNEFLFNNYNFKLNLLPKSAGALSKGSILVKLDQEYADEAYRLSIQEKQVELTGSAAGLFYGVQTLEQLAPPSKSKVLNFQAAIIKDEPRFGYRGLMLDVSRHFYSISYIKKFLTTMAHFKFNKFHWHLTDDQGWRIEIKKYPKLQSVAAWRVPLEREHHSPFIVNNRYGGFYTQEEIKEIVAYATRLHITVIPEIEMPGHSSAALTAYPHLGCTGGSYTVQQRGGVFKDVYCAGKDSTFLFLQDVLTEVLPLFPGQYIHIGGDETPKDSWRKCPRCQERRKAEGLKDDHELQSYFVQRIEKFINSMGKKMIGWDEILEGGLASNATVMSWRGEKGGIAAASQKHDVIMSPYTYLYFDYAQGTLNLEPPAFPVVLTLANVYKYEPLSELLKADEHKYIKGVQANIWAEKIFEEEHADYMIYPRALALSEIAWSPASAKNYDHFFEKLKVRLAALETTGINFRIPEPVNFKNVTTIEDHVQIDLAPSVYGAMLYYTLDGTIPTSKGLKYKKPFSIKLADDSPLVVKTMVVLPSGRKSNVYTMTHIKRSFKTSLAVSPAKQGLSFKATKDQVKLAKNIKIAMADTSGTTAAFTLSPFTSWPDFGVSYEGYFMAPEDEMYTFKVKSDDGAVLYVGDDLILDNDGAHAIAEASVSVPLRKGYHKIRLQYFDAGGGRQLEVKVSSKNRDLPLKDYLYYQQ